MAEIVHTAAITAHTKTVTADAGTVTAHTTAVTAYTHPSKPTATSNGKCRSRLTRKGARPRARVHTDWDELHTRHTVIF